ncbi:putative Holliday junction resolvase [Tetraselmis virus 1]|uniref:Putative Holliday junction resolvase n=1 Tax=Tetraselmis virus 1 TaxID=2060617 RepID=A0A2P0VND1_9VIRU|nr:putative Holliday junction resolvase [Tetraselmis virus 1]AUF82259.1 putative Holliday junction resolvase [Tetraselmis virus 1]
MRVLSIDVGIKNLGFCDITFVKNPEDFIINAWKVSNNSRADNSIDASIRGTVDMLDEVFSESGYDAFDVVLIENQPCFKNPKMKTVQTTIHAYMVMRASEETEIILASASGKNKLAEKILDIDKTKTTKYRDAKKRSIESTKIILESNEKNNKHLSDLMIHPKKDDMCDSFMQALYYFSEKKMLINMERYFPVK